MHTILHHAPYSTVNGTKIKTSETRSPEEWISEFDAEVHCSSIDLAKYNISISQGSAAAVRRWSGQMLQTRPNSVPVRTPCAKY